MADEATECLNGQFGVTQFGVTQSTQWGLDGLEHIHMKAGDMAIRRSSN